MWVSLLAFLFSITFKGTNYWLTPFSEWTSTLLFVNYFGFLSMINRFYDSVAEYNLPAPVEEGPQDQVVYMSTEKVACNLV